MGSLPKVIQLLAKEIYLGLKDSQIQLLTSSLAFTSLFAIVPLIAVFFSAFKAFGGMEQLFDTMEPIILSYLAPGSGESTINALRVAVTRANSGTMGTIGFFILLFSSMRLMLDIEFAFEKIWRVQTSRSWTLRILIYWTVLFMAPLAGAVVIGFIISQTSLSIAAFDQRLISFLFLFSALFILYKVIPPTKVRTIHAVLASFLATVSVFIAQFIYQWSTAYMITYNKIYGSFASIPFFLLWLLIIWWIILGGAILAAALRMVRRASPGAPPHPLNA